jgi:hypothetical protein
LFPHLSASGQLDLLFDLVEQGVEYGWHYTWILDALLKLDADADAKPALLGTLETRILEHTGKFDERERLLKKLRQALK